MPVLVTPEGGLFESTAIARYVAKLADTALVGRTPYESVRALVALPLWRSPRCTRTSSWR